MYKKLSNNFIRFTKKVLIFLEKKVGFLPENYVVSQANVGKAGGHYPAAVQGWLETMLHILHFAESRAPQFRHIFVFGSHLL